MHDIKNKLRQRMMHSIKNSILRLSPEDRRKKAAEIIRDHYPLVLMYHSVIPVYSGEDYAVSTKTLEQNITDLIADGYTFVFEDEFFHCPPQSVILTFDDGFANNYTEVFPLLRKYRVKASINLVADWVSDPQGEILTKEQIREMELSGLVQFQSHTCSHRSLNLLTPEEVIVEITESKKKLQELLSGKVSVFVYPREDFTEEIARAASEYYDLCYGWNGVMQVDQRYTLPRIEILEGDGDYAYYVLLEKKLKAYHKLVWSLQKNKPRKEYRRVLL